MSPRRTLVAATAFLGLVFAGSAASAVPVPIPGPGARPEGPELRERLRTQFERSFGGLNLRDLRPVAPAAPATAIGSPDPFSGLASGQFAAYASATVNHTAARLVGRDVDHDANFAVSHAAHSQAAVPRWDSETGRAAFPELAAGSSIGRALAAEFSESGAAEEDSVLPLDPVEAKAPPSSAPVTDGTDIDAPPLLKSRTLRADASARAVNGGCVLGNDLALGRANADAKSLVDTKGDARNPAPLLSLAADDPRRGVAQSLARTRLVPLPGQANRFGLLAETRQTVAPVTFFEGQDNEMTIEVAGEWILRAVADGTKGFVTLDVEREQDDDRPLLRIISRGGGGKKEVETVGDLEEFHALNGGGLTLSNGATVVLGESIRGLRGDTGSRPVTTGTRAAGALDILRLQTSDDPADAFARVGHMEAAVAVPTGGATCPGIGITKRSTAPTVDAGGRFSWLVDISNPNDCLLDKVKVLDTIQPSRGLGYRVSTTSPPGRVEGDTVTFDQLGPLQTGAIRNLRIDVEVGPNTAPGRFTNQAVATGLCGSVPVSGAAEEETEVDPPSLLDVVGRAGANEPAVRVPPGRSAAAATGPAPSPGDVIVRPAPLPSPSDSSHGAILTSSTSASRGAQAESSRTAGAALARTGGATRGLLGVALCGIGLAFRRFRPRRRSA